MCVELMFVQCVWNVQYVCLYIYVHMYVHTPTPTSTTTPTSPTCICTCRCGCCVDVCCGCGCVSVSDCYPFSPSLPLRACRKLTGPSSGTLSLTKSHEVSQLCIAADHKLTVMVYVCMLLSVWLNCWPSQLTNQCAYVICRHGYFLLL